MNPENAGLQEFVLPRSGKRDVRFVGEKIAAVRSCALYRLAPNSKVAFLLYVNEGDVGEPSLIAYECNDENHVIHTLQHEVDAVTLRDGTLAPNFQMSDDSRTLLKIAAKKSTAFGQLIQEDLSPGIVADRLRSTVGTFEAITELSGVQN